MPDRLDYQHCSPDERERMLDALTGHQNALLDELLRVVVAAERAGDFRADGALSARDWLAYRCNVSTSTANQWLRAGKALEELPRIRERFVAGAISWEQLNHAVSFATPAEDEHLAELLPSLSCAQIEVMAKQRRRLRRSEDDDARRRAFVRFRRDRSGLGSRVTGFLPTEDAAIVEAALERRAEAIGPDPQTGTWAPGEHRCAAAMRDLAADDLARGCAGGSEPDAAVVVVHAPLALLRSSVIEGERDAAGSATVRGDAIADEVLHRILCDTRLELHLDDAHGRTVGIGRASRNPPAWLRRRVRARDHGRCRWPGCNRPIRHLHHMVHWTRGGPTDACNLMGVCWHHHHLLHEGGWTATGDADGEISITSPIGRTVRSRAGPIAA